MPEAPAKSLRRLIAPDRIAVIGGREAGVVVDQCRRIGFAGAIEAVHPTRSAVGGVACVPSLDALEAPPDAAFLAIPPRATVEAVRELVAMGAGGAVCYAAGFGEAGGEGAALQAELVAAAGDMPLLGPNCYGLINAFDGVALWPDVHGAAPVDRGVAIVSQSGNMAINFTMQDRSLPVGHVATLGNAASTGIADWIAAYRDDPRVSAIGLYLESLGGDPAGFAAAVRAAQRVGKPVVALKTGRSAAGARVNLSHTSSLAGGGAAFDAYLARLGVPQVASVPAFLETLKLLHVHGTLPGRRIVSLSCSGGEAALVADRAEALGLETPPLGAVAEERLRAVLGERVALDNPLDYHTYIWGDRAALADCYAAALSAPVDAGLLVLDFPRPGLGDTEGWEAAVAALIDAATRTGRPTLCVASLPEALPAAVRNRLLAAGIAPMQGIDEALTALRAAAEAGAALGAGDPGPVRRATRPASVRPLDEWRAKRRLAKAGITVPDGALVTSATEAVAAAEAIGYPVVLKAVDATLAHKSEAGAVRLGLGDADAVTGAADDLLDLAPRLLVEAMVSDAVCELIVGISDDAQVGPCLLLGAGGVLAELIEDRAVLPLPTDRAAVEAALDQLRCARLIAGYRGRPAGDRDAVVEAVLAVAAMAEADGAIAALDINPLMVRPDGHGAVAADAYLCMADKEGDEGR